jgi:hypothetical protein
MNKKKGELIVNNLFIFFLFNNIREEGDKND